MTSELRRLAVACRLADLVVSRFADINLECDYELDKIGPFMGAANHRSLADLFVGMATFHRLNVQPQILFKKAFLPGPFSWVAERLGVIVVRGQGATDAAVEAVNAGSSLMIMIEGGLHYDVGNPKSLGPVKSGIARISRSTGRPMIPMSVSGTEGLWPKAGFPRLNPFNRKPVDFIVGAPIVATNEDDQQSADELSAVIGKALTR